MIEFEGVRSPEINGFREKCAVFGAISFTGRDVSEDTVLGLGSLQNRGQDGTGIAAYHPYSQRYAVHRELGLVGQVFRDGAVLDKYNLRSSLAVGHNRYRTSGSDASSLAALHPYVIEKARRSIVIGQNGNIPDRELFRLQDELPADTPKYAGTDTEVLGWRIMHAEGKRWEDKVVRGTTGVKGSFSLVIGTDDGALIGLRDPLGNRPLWMASTEDGIALASETHGFQRLDVKDIREVPPGNIVIARGGNVHMTEVLTPQSEARCIIEPVYFGHPVSREGEYTNRQIRERMGYQLAKEFPMSDIDIISGVPDGGTPVAMGYAKALSTYPTEVIVKDRYGSGIRTFIQGTQGERIKLIDGKYSISEEVIGKSMVVIDDSVVRGNTTKRLVHNLRNKGAAEVHILSGSPAIMYACDLGVDIASREHLVSLRRLEGTFHRKPDEQIAKELGADSIHYLSLDGLIEATGRGRDAWCTHCLTGEHPLFPKSAH